MLSLVLSGLASVTFEIEYLWSTFYLNAENGLIVSASHAQYLSLTSVTALKFLNNARRNIRNPDMPSSKTAPCLKHRAAQKPNILPSLDDPLVDQLFLRAQVFQNGESALGHTTPTITEIG